MMMKQLVFLLVVAMATVTVAEDATNEQPQLTEEQAKEAIFNISVQMKQEVEAAVKTINEVFGNPGCDQSQAAKRGSEFEKRFFGLYTGTKRDRLQLRELEAKKRSWKSFWKGAAVAAGAIAIFGKRSDEEKRSFGPYTGTKRDRLELRELEAKKRSWKSFWKGAAVAAGTIAIFGKRSDEEPEAPTDNQVEHPAETPVEEEVESPEAEIQFEADVAKLKEAVNVLNEVLMVADASLKN